MFQQRYRKDSSFVYVFHSDNTYSCNRSYDIAIVANSDKEAIRMRDELMRIYLQSSTHPELVNPVMSDVRYNEIAILRREHLNWAFDIIVPDYPSHFESKENLEKIDKMRKYDYKAMMSVREEQIEYAEDRGCLGMFSIFSKRRNISIRRSKQIDFMNLTTDLFNDYKNQSLIPKRY